MFTTLDDFIVREIFPTLDNPDEYDTDSIADEVSQFDSVNGYTWDKFYVENPDEYWKVAINNRKSGLCAYWLIDGTETEELYNAHFVDGNDTSWDISVLVSDDGDPCTTIDWECEQPENVSDCKNFDWIRCADWHLFVSDDITLKVSHDIIRELGR